MNTEKLKKLQAEHAQRIAALETEAQYENLHGAYYVLKDEGENIIAELQGGHTHD